ncbi:MAG TPA: MerR family transcriptional regulator [Acidimicrobiia bacterium]|jgi:DNA-binding transcriptional MerR regulator
MSSTTTPSEHLSIGEVLATLRDEFPDITISKIRFLESQGLIDPERTPSGYRKFYSDDVSRLRWILHQQKENFLPLKVIKSKLEEAGPGKLPEPAAVATAPPATATPSRKTAARAPRRKEPPRAAKSGKSTKAEPAAKRSSTPPLPLDGANDDDLDPVGDGALTRADLAAAAGLTETQIGELEDYGLITPVAGAGDRIFFDETAREIAQLAAVFGAHGIEPRHLRMYQHFAGREAGLYAQVLQPLLRQRNPEAHTRAREGLVELAQSGRALRTAFLRTQVGNLLTD